MSEAQALVVVIDDDPDIRNALQGLLETVDDLLYAFRPVYFDWPCPAEYPASIDYLSQISYMIGMKVGDENR